MAILAKKNYTSRMAKSVKKSLKLIGWAAISVLIFIGLWSYWVYRQAHPSTDDAYVKANVVQIASQVSGPVKQIFVSDHQMVKTGQPLFDIDPAPFLINVEKANANLADTKQMINAQIAGLSTANAELDQRLAELTDTQKETQRMLILVRKKLASKAKADDAKRQLAVAQAAVRAAQSQLEQQRQQLGDTGKNNTKLKLAQANLKQALLDLNHTHITAPADGQLINFNVRNGSMISAQQGLFSLVESKNWWIIANFKETQLTNIKVGQPAEINIDIYPNTTFKGTVDNISSGSGSSFSLLPPENATGNWVKTTQRFPIRINFTNLDLSRYPMRLGASCNVTINTKP